MALKYLTAAAMTACVALAADFFPIDPGNSWTYREAKTGETFSIRVGVPYLINNTVYYPLTGYATKQLLVRTQMNGDLVYLDEERGQEFPLTAFSVSAPLWWQAPYRACDQEGQALAIRSEHQGPIGTLRDVLDVKYRTFSCADAGVTMEQYAEHIGMVQRVITGMDGAHAFNLVEAQIGAMTIDTTPYGRFTVSVTDPPSGDLTVMLRLSTRPALPLKLTFPTAQEYDVVLRDLDGNVVWRWSDGQEFEQASHQREVGGEYRFFVKVPRPQNAAAYTIEGWLTTSGSAQFSATIPATVSPAKQ